MTIDRHLIIDAIRRRGYPDQASRAARELPHQVDTVEHASLLRHCGLGVHTITKSVRS